MPFPSLESSLAPDMEEVSFWTQLEAALQHIQAELQKPGVGLTLNLLKAANASWLPLPWTITRD